MGAGDGGGGVRVGGRRKGGAFGVTTRCGAGKVRGVHPPHRGVGRGKDGGSGGTHLVHLLDHSPRAALSMSVMTAVVWTPA
jgi:hypothetical protein